MPDSAQQQLLHLVIGGELTDLEHTTFKDLDQVEIVGVFPNYATAYAAWKAKAQQTVDNAHMRYFIVHLHRLLDPEVKTRSLPVEKTASQCAAQQLGSARAGRARGRISAAGLADQPDSAIDPPDVYEHGRAAACRSIFAFWHGQHFMTPFIKTKDSHRAKVLISRHRDGEFNAIAAERLGIGTIRGSGDHGGAFHRKGGVGAFREMVRALEDGYNVALTADVPKRSRVAGLGIIMLARESGRPIMPFAMATSRFIRLNNWDRTTINLPFGRGAVVGVEPIRRAAGCGRRDHGSAAPAAGDDLNEATRRAYAMVGRPEAGRG